MSWTSPATWSSGRRGALVPRMRRALQPVGEEVDVLAVGRRAPRLEHRETSVSDVGRADRGRQSGGGT